MKKRILVFLMVAAVALFMFGCGSAESEGTDAEAVTISFDVVVDGEVQSSNVVETDADNLGDALQASGIVEGKETSYGLFITTVDGVTADEANEEWWCVTKGGESVQTGVDSTPIADGDKFELTLMYGY